MFPGILLPGKKVLIFGVKANFFIQVQKLNNWGAKKICPLFFFTFESFYLSSFFSDDTYFLSVVDL